MAARGAAELRWATERRRSDSGASRTARLAGTRLQASSLLRRGPQILRLYAAVLRPLVPNGCPVGRWQLWYASTAAYGRAEKVDARGKQQLALAARAPSTSSPWAIKSE